MKTLLLLAASGSLFAPLLASESAPNEPMVPTPDSTEVKPLSIPEPSPLITAGIGALAIFVFTVRRK